MRGPITAALAGLLFAVGLAVGGMTDPNKVLAFLDVTGDWDPSLAFVMAGAVGVYAVAFRLVGRRAAPLFRKAFALPTRRDIDGRLVGGAVLFGLGWGLSGYCPGPAVVGLTSLAPGALVFGAAMALGFGIAHLAGFDSQSDG